jgi:RHS repeat-associated protein
MLIRTGLDRVRRLLAVIAIGSVAMPASATQFIPIDLGDDFIVLIPTGPASPPGTPGGASSATPLPVGITPPHLGNSNAGTLAGSLSVSDGGAATYGIPITVPPGTAGLAPSLSLSYSSQGTNGVVGLGWSLSGLSSVQRCGKTIAQDGVNDRIRFANSDRLCLDGQRLILKGQTTTDDSYWAAGAEFRTEIDSFSRITAIGPLSNRTYKVETRDGRIMTYGGPTSTVKAIIGSVNSGATAPQPQPKNGALAWGVERIQDRAGNFISFSYTQDLTTGEHLPQTLRYGGNGQAPHAAVQFVYESRADAWKKYVDEARDDMRNRLSKIKTFVGGDLSGDVSAGTWVSEYSLAYQQSPTSGRSLLQSVQACGRNPHSGATECLPATTFDWGKPDPSKPAGFINRGVWSGAPIMTTWRRKARTGGGWHRNSMVRTDFFAFADFENHGRTDVLEKRVAAPDGPDDLANPIETGTIKTQYRYFHNTGSGFTTYNYRLNTGESFAVLGTGDVNGDGAPDLVVSTANNGPKVCLSPLARPSGLPAPGNPIVFTCDPNLKATGENVVKKVPYVGEIVGDGRAAINSPVNADFTSTQCIQGSCTTVDNAPSGIVGVNYPTYVDDYRTRPSGKFNGFEQSVDFAGTGRHTEVGWSKAYYLGTYWEGPERRVFNQWVNTAPEVTFLGFLPPGSTERGTLAAFRYPDYQPSCQGYKQKPYDFERPQGNAPLAADFNGSGYSSLMFGYTEYAWDNETCHPSFNRAELTQCLSTGRALDCSVRKKYSGENYRAVRAAGNFIGDGAPALLVETMVAAPPSVPQPSGNVELCRVKGDDTTNGTGTNDTNMVCEPWPGVVLPKLQPLPSSTGSEGLDRLATDEMFLMDLLGTGREQVVIYHSGVLDANDQWQEDGRWEVFEPRDRAVAGQSLDRIHKVTNGMGQVSSVEYAEGLVSGVVSRTDSNNLSYPQRASAGTGKIVAKLRVGNGVSGNRTTSFKYFDPAVDAAGRGSLGFAAVESTDVDTGIVTTRRFAQGWPFTGLTKSTTVVANGCTLSDTQNRLASRTTTGGTTFAFVAGSTEARRDLDGCLQTETVTVSGVGVADVQYDGDGNLLSSQTVTTGGGHSFTQQTVNTYYAADTPNWLNSRLKKASVTKSQTTDNKSITRATQFTYDAAGRVATETLMPDDTGATMKMVTTYDRSNNVFGLVGKKTQQWTDPLTTQAVSRFESKTYDANGRYPATVTNAAGHQETRTHDPGTGAQLSLTDPDQLTTTWEVDAFGRATRELRADGNETRHYRKQCDGQCPVGAVAAEITEQFHGADRISVPGISYTDSAGHALRAQTWGFDGRAIVADSRYDALGRLWEVDHPRYSADAARLAKRQGYDILGRVRSLVTLDEQGVERTNTTSYQGLVTVNTNANSQKRTDTRDAIGRVVQVVDAKSGVTKFAYDPFGNLVQTTDPNGNIISVEFDSLGRRTKLTDPDLGRIDYTVDAAGRTRRQVNPLQRAISSSADMQYDSLDRMTARMEPDLESHWVFDTAPKGIGQLAEAYTGPSTAKDYRRVHTYDSLGRPSTTTQYLTDGAYTSTPTYDAWSRVVTQTQRRGTDNPKAYDTRYNNKGYLARVERGSTVLWEAKAQAASQHVTEARLGNGLVQQHVYSPHTSRLTSGMLKTVAGNLVRLQEGYSYDSLGNVLERSQYWDSTGFTETFHYDELNRVDWSEVSLQARQSFGYDAAGNLLRKTGVGSGDYVYGTQGAGAVRPHAVKSIPGIGSFTYDDNGNLKSGAGRTATWTTFDMPVKITKGTQSSTFAYGPEHQRARQLKQDGSSVVYTGTQEVELSSSGQMTSIKTYWPNGLGVEIDKPNAATELNWLHRDRLGSPVAITDASGNLKEKLAYDAWGKRRTVDGAPVGGTPTPDSLNGQVDNKGFTGHEMLDALDLVHMNGRVYDPLTARFISGDPIIQEPQNGQNYNRYSYVLNNPTNLTDPTGFCHAVDTTTNVCPATEAKAAGGEGKHESQIGEEPRSKFCLACTVIPINPDSKSSGKDPDGNNKSSAKDGRASGQGNKDAGVTASQVASNLWNNPDNWLGYMRQTFENTATTFNSLILYLGAKAIGQSELADGAEHALLVENRDATVATGMLAAGGLAMRSANPAQCFVAGTMVETSGGLKPIEQIQVGDLVVARDEATAVTSLKPVVGLFRNSDKEVLRITLASVRGDAETLGVTPEHPFRVLGRGWTAAASLQAGDQVEALDGEALVVSGMVRDEQRVDTYNFEVKDFHTYFVGRHGALVHNQCMAKPIPSRITPGSLSRSEEAAVLSTLNHIDAGTKPVGALAKKWGTTFQNRDGDLPGVRGANSPYREYRVAPPPGTSGAGANRIVVNSQSGEVYYTWTHYGDNGRQTPAFVQIR